MPYSLNWITCNLCGFYWTKWLFTCGFSPVRKEMFSQVYSLTEWLFVICTLARLLTLHSVQLCDFSWTNVFFTFGISVKWIRKCLLNVSVWLKDFLHSPQHGGFSPLWMNKCSVILHAWVNDLLHGVHHVGLDEHWARFDGVIAEKMRLFHFVEVWPLSSVCFDVISDIRGYSRGKVAFGAFLSQTAKEKMV